MTTNQRVFTLEQDQETRVSVDLDTYSQSLLYGEEETDIYLKWFWVPPVNLDDPLKWEQQTPTTYFSITVASVDDKAYIWRWDNKKLFASGKSPLLRRDIVLYWLSKCNYFVNIEGLKSFTWFEFGNPDIEDSY